MKPFVKFICGESVDKTLIKSSDRKRQWMDDTDSKFAYRCLPLVIANQYGWEFCSPVSFKAVWYGGIEKDQIEIFPSKSVDFVKSHFGSGILTFSLNVIIVTDELHDLMITGPLNSFKHGINPLSAVIESDWMPYTFTMNWKFTEENSSVEFQYGEPICRVFPVPKNIEEFDVSIENNSDNVDICEEMIRWANKRNNFDSEKNNTRDWNKNLPGLYYKGVFSDGTAPKTKHKTRLNLQCPIKTNSAPIFEGKCIDNVVSHDDCANIIQYAEKNIEWENAGHEFWDGRVINLQQITDPTIFKLLLNIKDKIEDKIVETYNLKEPIYADIFQIVRWDEGTSQPVHADAYNQDGSLNDLSWRKFGSVLYLNDDFSGGKTYYPNYDIEVTPKTGSLAIHLGDLNHNHGVTEVQGNIRYTLASFWGFDKAKGIVL